MYNVFLMAEEMQKPLVKTMLEEMDTSIESGCGEITEIYDHMVEMQKYSPSGCDSYLFFGKSWRIDFFKGNGIQKVTIVRHEFDSNLFALSINNNLVCEGSPLWILATIWDSYKEH